ncbi:hypothetical protein KF840_04135 [bacterium]|nr:hypothetical protein [bacterium]
MPLYLDEIWIHWDSPARAREVLQQFSGMANGTFPYPEGVTQVAGPWFSNEEAKIVLVLDIADHAKTFTAFGVGLAHGLITRRRLTPVVDWRAVDTLIDAL